MQIHSTIRYYLTPFRMAIRKKMGDKKCQWGSGEKSMLYTLWKCKLIQILWKILQSCLNNLKLAIKIELCVPLISLLSISPVIMKSRPWRVICTPMLTATLVIIAPIAIMKVWNNCPPTDKWIRCDIYLS